MKFGLHIHEVVLSTIRLLSLRSVVVMLVQYVDSHIDSISGPVPRLPCIERLCYVAPSEGVRTD